MFPVHVAAFYPKGSKEYLFLFEREKKYQWVEVNSLFQEKKVTDVSGETIPFAIAQGRKIWNEEGFKLVHCGFRYTLPERDQVGANAYFSHMAQSYAEPLGTYFDKELGHQCFVDFASTEALTIWRALKK